MDKPTVAVCLACYNGIEWVEKQCESIISQHNVDVTIFVGVDRSTDGTYELVQNIAANHSNVQILNYGTRFGSAAGNFFNMLCEIGFSKYDYVAFSDQDDIWFSDKLDRAILSLEKNEAHFYSSNVIAFWPNGQERLIVKNQKIGAWNHLFEAAGPGCTYVFKADLATKIGVFLRENKSTITNVALHDWFIFAWAKANDYCWFIDDYAGMLYRQHDNNEFGVNRGYSAAKNRWYRLINGWYRDQVLLLAELVGQKDVGFVRRLMRLNFFDRFVLSVNAFHFRRSWRDKIILAVAFLCMRSRGGKDA